MQEDISSKLSFTGERFLPECPREIWYEHWHRYAFARRFAAGKVVLDAASGEGYGAALLAGEAKQVCALDISAHSQRHAAGQYTAPNLSFYLAECGSLPFVDNSFDLVTSFETLEHLLEQRQMLAEFSRVLCDDGLLLISTPDRENYSELNGLDNPYHLRELYRNQFEELLATHFSSYRLWGQKLLFQSAIWSLSSLPKEGEMRVMADQELLPGPSPAYPPTYYLALCAVTPEALTAEPAISLFGDLEESVYRHYDDEVRRNIHAGKVLQEYERQIAELQAQLEATSPRSEEAAATQPGEMSAVVVNYNSGPHLANCVADLLANACVRVVVVDNASEDGSLAGLPEDSRLQVVANPSNMGYAAAANLGARHLDGDYLAFVNPDCRLRPQVFARMRAAMESNPAAAVAGCRVINPDGSIQRATYRRYPSFARAAVSAFRLDRWLPGVNQHRADVEGASLPVEAVSGAFLFARAESLRSLDFFDASYFLHCEDLDLFKRIALSGSQVILVDSVEVVHHKGAAGATSFSEIERHKHRGMMRFYDRYQRSSWPPGMRWIAPMMIRAHLWFRLATRSLGLGGIRR